MTTQPPPPPSEAPPIIRPQSTLPARYRRRRRSPWRTILVGGFVGVPLSAVLLWYFGPRFGVDLLGASKHSIKSMIGYRLGSNPWKIKNWGTPFSMDGYLLEDMNAIEHTTQFGQEGWIWRTGLAENTVNDPTRWGNLKEPPPQTAPSGMMAYPFEFEAYSPTLGWRSETYVGVTINGEAIWCGLLSDWFRQTSSPAEQRVKASRGEDKQAVREAERFRESLNWIPLE